MAMSIADDSTGSNLRQRT